MSEKKISGSGEQVTDAVELADGLAKRVDACGLICPEPVMLLHSAVRDVKAGDCIEVIATDPSTERDIARFCEFLSHQLVSFERLERDGTVSLLRFVVRKGGS